MISIFWTVDTIDMFVLWREENSSQPLSQLEPTTGGKRRKPFASLPAFLLLTNLENYAICMTLYWSLRAGPLVSKFSVQSHTYQATVATMLWNRNRSRGYGYLDNVCLGCFCHYASHFGSPVEIAQSLCHILLRIRLPGHYSLVFGRFAKVVYLWLIDENNACCHVQ